jgi:7-carboxy-7-deazaguanine synthase
MLISEIFHSLQGEGLLIGLPTVFVRTSGCNLRCKWCDTDYAFEGGQEMSIEEVLDSVGKYNCLHVCLTGGEPLLQKDAIKLINALLEKGYLISIETGGSVSVELLPCDDNLSISLDIKCPSSGEHDRMNFSNLELLSPNDQLKFVIADGEDYEYAKKILDEYETICQIVMQPVGGTDMKALAEKVLDDKLNVRVLPQLHKLIWGVRRGV